jgi:hypothetical protein
MKNGSFFLVFMIVSMLSGCSTGTIISKSASFAVSKYCKVPEVGRKVVRAAVGRAVFPNKIEITCIDE